MSNYSGTEKEKQEKRRKYDKARKVIRNEQLKVYRSKPEVKDKIKEQQAKYRSTPKYKEWKKNYRNLQSTKDARRNQLLIKNFGITLEDYTKMLVSQKNVCAICLKTDPPRSLAVDHCHKTGRIRGLLCRACNVSIGLFEDDDKRLERAIRYLQNV